MNGLDFFLLLVLAFSLFRGYQRGLILQMGALVGVFIGIWAAYRYADKLTPWMKANMPLPIDLNQGLWGYLPIGQWIYYGISFLALFMGSRLLFSIVISFVNQIARLPLITTANRLGGVMIGILQFTLVLFISLNILQALPGQIGQTVVKNSMFAQATLGTMPDLTTNMQRKLGTWE
ncbi:CvpA family protein [Hazenella sp. IB182357]|uniref:CvpA family protein n=1 Tax=Polycladospora coralii TaxID=2771432 RepID=A0A926NB05_9BACL|nr:CvpA family protein [Polycladospora coralii]MBD1372822.1 CvpA family protein [Polycladospora coralii]MBS7529480.1 CvpA family protein [Polycladospora coralii]